MDKLLTYSVWEQATGPHIFPLYIDNSRTMIKMARPLPVRVQNYIQNAKPIPNRAQLLIDSMGSGEFWGANVNSDYFPEEALRHRGSDYGYQTFETNAYPYKHHVNKDPAAAYGDRVTLSDYDPYMHRVLLIVSVDDQKCRDILDDLARGIHHAVSMGCRVPNDRCSICGNLAKTRAQYCAHLRTQMNQILPDGRRVCAINDRPKFFDISFVTIGAEKASHVLQKVASSGLVPNVGSAEAWDKHAALKAATEKKTADIDKKVPSTPPAVIRPLDAGTKDVMTGVMDAAGEAKHHERALTPDTLDALAATPEALRDVLATLAVLGVDLRPHEFQRLALSKLGHAKLAGELWSTRAVFDEARPSGVIPQWAEDFGVHPTFVSQKVAGLVAPYLVDRSCHGDILAARLDKLASGMIYHRNNAWYPQTPDEQKKSSGMPGIVPASLGLAAAFMAFKRLFPDLGKSGPLPLRILAAHPWLLPLLIGAGVGARVGFQTMTAPRPLGSARIERPLDAMQGPDYDGQAQEKTASIKSSLLQLGLIPLTYIYAGVQQRRWERGEKLNAVDRLIARRPDLASIATVAIAPHFATGIKNLAKHSSVEPCSTIDSLIFRGLERFTH